MKEGVFWWWFCGLKWSGTPDDVLIFVFDTLNMVRGNVAGIGG
jgi:hypothetical protein